ncbi:hypothetical protein HK102_009066 [Quaeritorhiza haematococci]|nr:hypothetical protein HK102_009066 [Quaeritorhiza haematococci]
MKARLAAHTDDGADSGESVVGAEKETMRVQMVQAVADYKQSYQQLKDLKIEIEHLQHLLEQARLRMTRDFEHWYVSVYQPFSPPPTSTSLQAPLQQQMQLHQADSVTTLTQSLGMTSSVKMEDLFSRADSGKELVATDNNANLGSGGSVYAPGSGRLSASRDQKMASSPSFSGGSSVSTGSSISGSGYQHHQDLGSRGMGRSGTPTSLNRPVSLSPGVPSLYAGGSTTSLNTPVQASAVLPYRSSPVPLSSPSMSSASLLAGRDRPQSGSGGGGGGGGSYWGSSSSVSAARLSSSSLMGSPGSNAHEATTTKTKVTEDIEAFYRVRDDLLRRSGGGSGMGASVSSSSLVGSMSSLSVGGGVGTANGVMRGSGSMGSMGSVQQGGRVSREGFYSGSAGEYRR